MKKILCLLLFTFALFVGTNSAYAETPKSEGSEISNMFTNFIDDAFNDIESLEVLNSSGQDITDEFVKSTKKQYNNGDYESIQNLISDQNLSIAVETITPTVKKDNKMENAIQSSIRSKSISKRFYHLEWDSTNTFRKEWTTTLSGTISYNGSTYKITNLSGPRINYQANFGAAFNTALKNINPSSRYSGTSATLSATYTMTASGSVPGTGDVPIGATFNFGRHTDTLRSSSLPGN